MDPRSSRPLEDADYAALARFRRQIREFLHFSETVAHREGLEPQQHQALLAIRALRPDRAATVGELAEQLGIRHHSAVGLADRLAAKGLIVRMRGPSDRRQVLLRITDEGAEVLDRLSGAHQDELRRTGPNLVAALTELLERLDAGAPEPLAQGKE